MAHKSKPKTGEKTDSSLVSFLKTLSSGDASSQVPEMPSPMFDKYMGGKFKKKKKKKKKDDFADPGNELTIADAVPMA